MTTTLPQYATGDTRARIEHALGVAGVDTHALQARDLALLEDFHTLGRMATAGLVELAQISARDRVLDAGTGIGGSARLIAGERGAHVTAVDITPEYCAAAAWLNELVGLSARIEVAVADVTALPFEDGVFDVVVSQHVQMNIADKPRFYGEARRVLAAGGRLAVWDVVAGASTPLLFPVPWATEPGQSHLVAAEQLRDTVTRAGFAVRTFTDLTEGAVTGMRGLLDAPRPPLGLHVFVEEFPVKARNLLANLEQGRARVVQGLFVAV